MGPFVAVHTDAGARPRIELAIQDALAIEYLHPQWVGEELVVHAGFRAALGGVGLGIANATFEVLDEQGSVLFRSEPLASPPRTSTTFTPNWSWPPGESVPGEYSVRVSATTTEGSAKVEAHLTFEHQPEESSPAPGPLLVALAVLAAIVSRRR